MAWAVTLSQGGGTISNGGNYTRSQFVIPASLNATCVRWCRLARITCQPNRLLSFFQIRESRGDGSALSQVSNTLHNCTVCHVVQSASYTWPGTAMLMMLTMLPSSQSEILGPGALFFLFLCILLHPDSSCTYTPVRSIET